MNKLQILYIYGISINGITPLEDAGEEIDLTWVTNYRAISLPSPKLSLFSSYLLPL